jgi:hypothetical protein
MTVPILTSSWRTPIDDGRYVRVGVSRSTRGVPRGFRRFAGLEPGKWFASIRDPVEWQARYNAEMLSKLDPARVVADLRGMSDGARPIVLLCWEPSDASGGWCHRALISVWLKERLDLDVRELDREDCGCGRSHPLLPEVLRAR